MKVNIGPYKNWFGPFQLAETLLFWKQKDDPLVYKLGHFFAFGTTKEEKLDLENLCKEETWLYALLTWLDSKKSRKVKIKIHKYDTWSMDHTLALIIVPMLKQLKETTHGAPLIADEDVPPNMGLRSTEAEPKKNSWDVDSNHFNRWDWVLDEMIWAFQQIGEDRDMYMSQEEAMAYHTRIKRGTTLFGKYYSGLWD